MSNATELWIPDEIWLDILENYIPVAHAPGSPELRHTLSSLSLTCTRLRGMTLPAVYHSLAFRLNPDETQQGGLVTMRSVLRAESRANSLARSPHLLQHVREFTLVSWDPKTLGPPAPGDYSAADELASKTREARWWAAHDVVTGLVLQMSRLRRLCVVGSAITLRLCVSILCNSGLESLVLSSDNGYHYSDPDLEISQLPMIDFPEEEPPPSIRHLDLIGLDEWDESIDFPDLFGVILSDHVLRVLSLKIYFPHIPLAFSAIADLSALQSLSVELAGPDDYLDFHALRGFLQSSPALLSLEFFSGYKWTTGAGLRDLPADALPNLEVVSGPLEVVVPLISGRPVNTICLRVHNVEALESFDIPTSSAAQVHTLKIDVDTYSLLHIISTLKFSHCFVNSTHLKIRYRSLIEDGMDAWEINGTMVQSYVLTLFDTLSRLPWLLVCWVLDPDHLATFHVDRPTDEQGCPIGQARNPAARGHPSLEEMLLLHPTIWRWYPGEGWTPQISQPHMLDM